MDQFPAIVVFRLELIFALDSGSLPRLYGEFMYAKIKNRGVLTTTGSELAKTTLTRGLGLELGLG